MIYLIAHKYYTSEVAFLRPKTGSRIAHLPLLNCGELYSGEEADIILVVVGNRGESFAQRSHNNLEFSKKFKLISHLTQSIIHYELSLPQCPVLLVCLVPMVAVYWYIQHFYR